MPGAALPDPALVVLVGAAAAGKSTWAQGRYRRDEIVSSDELRGVVGSGRHDLDASTDAFRLLDDIVAARTRRGLTCVIDTLGLDPARRRGYLDRARTHGLPAVVVVFDAAADVVRERNARRDVPVPARVLAAQLARLSDVRAEIDGEGWDIVHEAGSWARSGGDVGGSRRPQALSRCRANRTSSCSSRASPGERTPRPGCATSPWPRTRPASPGSRCSITSSRSRRWVGPGSRSPSRG